MVLAIAYDRDQVGADDAALSCHNDLAEQLNALGYTSSRLGIHSMDRMTSQSAAHRAVVQRIKAALDPNHIIAPGRYLTEAT